MTFSSRSGGCGFRWLARLAPLLIYCGCVSVCDARKWRVYENCVLEPNEANDGDSFHVKYKNRRYLFRLYFVDTPETDDSIPERVKEQAAYWGIDEQTSIRLGKEAARFTARFLDKGFTAYSKLQDARGRSDKDRDYAIIKVGEQDLAEELVRNGLARVYGMGIDLPDDTGEKVMWWRLKTAEREARTRQAGGWNPAFLAHAAVGAVPAITQQDVVLKADLPVFSVANPGQQVGVLRAGASLTVLKAVSETMVHIRFGTSDGRTLEGLSRRGDLGL